MSVQAWRRSKLSIPNMYPMEAGGGGGFSPGDISGLALWFDFADASQMYLDNGVTNVASDGDKIYRINDKSANGFNLVQATENDRPLYKTGIINGLSCGYIADISDSLSNASYKDCAQMTSILVVRPYNLTANQPFHTELGAGSENSVFGYKYSYILRASTQTTGIQDITDSQVYNDTNYILSLVYDGSFFKIYKNGVDITSGTVSATGNFRFKYMGGQLVYWGEWIGYDKALSDVERGLVEAYLNAKWSVF